MSQLTISTGILQFFLGCPVLFPLDNQAFNYTEKWLSDHFSHLGLLDDHKSKH